MRSLGAIGDYVFVNTPGGLYRSPDNGTTWTKVFDGTSGMYANAYVGIDSVMLIGGGGIYRSVDGGGHWTINTNASTPSQIVTMAVLDGYVFAGSYYNGMYRSSDRGETWEKVNTGLSGAMITQMAVAGRYLFVGTGNQGLYRSADMGATWTPVNIGRKDILALGVCGSTLLASYSSGIDYNIIRSLDNGDHWTSVETGSTLLYVYTIISFGGNAFIGTPHGVFRSTNNGASWANKSMGLLPELIALDVNIVAPVGTDLFIGTNGSGVLSSWDDGRHWTHQSNNLGTSPINMLVSSGSTLYAGNSDGLFFTTDRGMTWKSIPMFKSKKVMDVAFGENAIFVAADTAGVYRSTDQGVNWMPVNVGLAGTRAQALFIDGGTVYLGTNAGIFISKDNGLNWVPKNTGLTNLNVHDIAIGNQKLYAATDQWVFISKDDGASWESTTNRPYSGLTVNHIVMAGGNVYAAGWYGVYCLSFDEKTWTSISSNLPKYSSGFDVIRVFDVKAANQALYIATWYGVWKRPLSEVTAIETITPMLPVHFGLDQNFPNPFNPTTTIQFSIATKSFVSLQLFDVMGREVATLVSETLSAGNYHRQWNASGYPSGVYFYRLRAGRFEETRRLIVVK